MGHVNRDPRESHECGGLEFNHHRDSTPGVLRAVAGITLVIIALGLILGIVLARLIL